MGKFLIVFIIITFSEVYLMKVVAEKTSFLFLLGVVLTTGFIGLALAKKQGKEHLIKIQQEIAAGKIPGNPVIEGLMILVAAAVLITPGFITDVIGFLLLVPFVRKLFAPGIAKMLKPKVLGGGGKSSFFTFTSGGGPFESSGAAPKEKETVDADFFDMPQDESSNDEKKNIEG